MPYHHFMAGRTQKGSTEVYAQTHTHADRVNSICPSTILWRGHKKHAYLQTILKAPVKFQKDLPKTVQGIAGTRYQLQI